MDLIRELKDVRFELNLRGYDCDAVDAFLAKVRTEVADVQSQQENALQRVSSLEEQLSSGESDTEGTLRRTLVLAQRLADETVADARNTATEMVESATADAEETRQTAAAEADESLRLANQEAAATLQSAREELERAQADAEATDAAVATEAARARASAIEEANRLLNEAESAGATRVASLESAAQDEAARMREPIRAEVEALEGVRGGLLSDIEALEQHLVDQRVRVRNAVDALRVGMSGSIEDLERVADDDELLSQAERPDLGGAEGSDVPEAAQIEIIDQVEEIAEPAPTADQLADEVRVAIDADEAERSDAAVPAVDVEDDDAVAPRIDDDDAVAPRIDDDDAVAPRIDDEVQIEHDGHEPGPETEQIPVIEIDADQDATPESEVESHVDEALVIDDDDAPDDGSEVAELVDVDVVVETEVDEAIDHDVVDLDSEAGALFGTELTGDDIDAVDHDPSDPEGEVEPAVPVDKSDGNFLASFAEAIDTLPVGRES